MTRVPYIDLPTQHAPIKRDLLAAVERVLDHGYFVNGPEVEQFETRFAALCGTSHAVGVSNGTAALTLILKGLGIGPGDEVITPPNSFLASTSCVVLAGATPVFADVRDDYNIDPAQVEAVITPRTKAVIAVHLTGRPADLDALVALCDRHHLALVEDCAQAVGARYRNRPVGSFGVAGAFSMHPLKTLNAAGDGGVITTSDAALAAYLRQARNHGLRSRDECAFFSPNERLDTLQAAMLLVKLDHVDAWTSARRRNAAYYQDHLRDVPGLIVPEDRPHEHAVYHTFVVQSDDRDALQSHLQSAGIDTKIHYPIPIHRQPAAKGIPSAVHPVTERHATRILSLPVHSELTDADVQYVSRIARSYMANPPQGNHS